MEVPEGKFKWVVSLANYKRLEKKDTQLASKPIKQRLLSLEKTSYLSYETTVYGQTDKRDDGRSLWTRLSF